jgi:hypothetical protein
MHYVIALVAVILVGTAVKWVFFSTPSAEADTPDAPASLSIMIEKMHSNTKNLPVQIYDAH